MKRIAFLTVTLLLVMSILTGCIVIPLRKKFRIDEDRVSSIEIYDFCQYKAKYEEVSDVTLKEESPVYKIPEEEIGAFLTDLGEIQFKDSFVIILAPQDPSFSYGAWTIRINYTDGSYQLLSTSNYGTTHNADGEQIETHHYGCDDEDMEALLHGYLPEEAFQHRH